MVGIYKVTNKINNKIYIGLSINIAARWRRHRSGPFDSNNHQYNCSFYRAIRKYGLENFIFEVIEECSSEELNSREIYWINYYNSTDPSIGYNLTTGGSTGQTFSKLTLEEATEIQNLLIETTLSQQSIAEEYNISQKSVSNINTGETWFKESLDYPLRKKSILIDPTKRYSTYKTCLICGKPISNKASYCIDCVNKTRRTTERPTREELKRLIRIYPFTQLGKQFNVSDTAIKKWCKAYNLPSKKLEINKFSEEEWDKI